MGFGPYRYEAMTGETPAPAESGITSPWTHFVEEDGHGDVLRFWHGDSTPGGTLEVVYEPLAEHVDDARARWLIDEMYFVVLTMHYHRDRVREIAYRRLGSDTTERVPYPDRPRRTP